MSDLRRVTHAELARLLTSLIPLRFDQILAKVLIELAGNATWELSTANVLTFAAVRCGGLWNRRN